ncbi:hypothetical protein ACFW7J_03720, partial [Streptomyces sp. NPDC059525]|uniref:hypothetical protein n=1 Tax=Streptomyces sp. NPDC059525 TaxID=3346857 RepID=UPI0036AAF3EB
LRQSLGLDLPLHTLFEQRTVAALAIAVETLLLAELDAEPSPFTATDAAVPSLVLQGETS